MPQKPPGRGRSTPDMALSPEGAWALLLALAGRRREGAAERLPLGFTLGPDGGLRTTPADDGTAHVTWSDPGLACTPGQPRPVRDLIELYAPLFPGGAEIGRAHV